MSTPKPPRPTFFEDTANDRLTAIITALVTEVAGLSDRVATLENLLAAQGVLSPDAVDHHVLTEQEQAARLAPLRFRRCSLKQRPAEELASGQRRRLAQAVDHG